MHFFASSAFAPGSSNTRGPHERLAKRANLIEQSMSETIAGSDRVSFGPLVPRSDRNNGDIVMTAQEILAPTLQQLTERRWRFSDHHRRPRISAFAAGRILARAAAACVPAR